MAAEAGLADEALIRAARSGSSRAFSELVDQHQQAVRAFLRRLTGDHAEADDLAQEVFLAAWSDLGRWRGEASLRAWLCGIAWRKAKGVQRAGFRRASRDGAYERQADFEQAKSVAAEDRMALQSAMAALPLDERATVALCLAGDFSHSEAAQALGLPLGTVKSHVARGRAKLLQVLGERP